MLTDPSKAMEGLDSLTGVNELMKTVKALDDEGRKILLKALGEQLTDAKKQSILAQLKGLVTPADAKIKNWLVQGISKSYVAGMNSAQKFATINLQPKGVTLFKWVGGDKGAARAEINALAGNVDPFNLGGIHFALDPQSSKEFGDVLTASILPKQYKLVELKSLLPASARNLSADDMLARANILAADKGMTVLQLAKAQGFDGVIYPSNENQGKWVALNETVAKTKLIPTIPTGAPSLTVQMLQTVPFMKPHLQAVNALLSDAYLDFGTTMTGYVRGAERILNDALRKQIRSNIGAGRLEGEGVAAVKKVVKETFSDRGFTVLIDRGGRQWSLDQYSEMVTRTHIIKANNEGVVNRAGDFEIDIVEVDTHGAEDSLCEPQEGKIYSISGKSKNYPPLADNDPPFHPNCKHTLLLRPDLT